MSHVTFMYRINNTWHWTVNGRRGTRKGQANNRDDAWTLARLAREQLT